MKRIIKYTRVTGHAVVETCHQECNECQIRFYCFTEPLNEVFEVSIEDFVAATKRMPNWPITKGMKFTVRY